MRRYHLIVCYSIIMTKYNITNIDIKQFPTCWGVYWSYRTGHKYTIQQSLDAMVAGKYKGWEKLRPEDCSRLEKITNRTQCRDGDSLCPCPRCL